MIEIRIIPIQVCQSLCVHYPLLYLQVVFSDKDEQAIKC